MDKEIKNNEFLASDDEQFEDANERTASDLLNESNSTSKKEDSDAETFHECETSDIIDDESQKDYEKYQTDEEREQARLEALELKDKGNEEFRKQNFEKSIEIYSDALKKCPVICQNERSIIYGNRALSKIKLGLKKAAIDDCTKSLEFNPKYVKVLLRRAALNEETNMYDESLDDFKKVLEIDPQNSEARSAQIRLPPLINQKNEKMKEEMIEKLKDLGNMVLRPFGLSTGNFEMKQDPTTGSYSINFNQNPK
ncbi:tetratricopeptide repeat protein 1-like [Chironomus tepperi]|uniref:tetratricopeptide repeat protein 1-like n=1 Tax=Chironomus tepperi TaxID=113505 RepID=UPI00391F2DAA